MKIEPFILCSIETSRKITIATVARTKACFQYRFIAFVASTMTPLQTFTDSFSAGNPPQSSLVEQMFHANDGRGGRAFKRRRIVEGGDHIVAMDMEDISGTNALSDGTMAAAQTPNVVQRVHDSTRPMQQSQASQRQQEQQSRTMPPGQAYCYYCSCYYCTCRAVALGSTHVLTSA